MGIEFEWDPNKAEKNIKKHQVSFNEAATVFGDPLSMTFYDPIIRLTKTRISLLGYHALENCSLFHMQIEATAYVSLAHEKQRAVRGSFMKNTVDAEFDDELRAEYDLSQLQGGIRGKYVQRYSEGTNLVLLAPDVAEVFPTDEAVNEALRLLIKIAKAQVNQQAHI
jgi:uncharacterized DUF497 family protein